MQWRKLAVLLSLLAIGGQVSGQRVQHFLRDWQTFDDQGRLQPVVLPAPQVTAAHLRLSTEGLETFAIQVPVRPGTSLWVGNRLWRKATESEVWVVRLDSVSRAFGGEDLWIGLYHSEGSLPLSEVVLMDPFADATPPPALAGLVAPGPLDPLARHQPYRDSLVTVLVLLVLVGFSVIKLYRAWTFRAVFDIRSYLSAFGIDPRLFAQGFLRNQLLLAILPSLGWGLCWVVINEQQLSATSEHLSVGQFLWPFLRQAVLVYALLVLKLFLLYLLCAFLGESDLYERHYFEFLRALSVTIALVMSALILTRVQGIDSSQWLPYVGAVLCVGVLLRLAWVIRRNSSLAGLYLFSYLCTTEAFPLLIAWRSAF